MLESSIRGYILVTEAIEPAEEGGFVSVCPELGVASQGETIDEALVNLKEAVLTFLDTLEALDDLKEFIEKRAIRVYAEKPDAVTSVQVKPGEVVTTLVATLGKGLSVSR